SLAGRDRRDGSNRRLVLRPGSALECAQCFSGRIVVDRQEARPRLHDRLPRGLGFWICAVRRPWHRLCAPRFRAALSHLNMRTSKSLVTGFLLASLALTAWPRGAAA